MQWPGCLRDILHGPYSTEEGELNFPLKVTGQLGVLPQWPIAVRNPEVSSPKDLEGKGIQMGSGLEIYSSIEGLLGQEARWLSEAMPVSFVCCTITLLYDWLIRVTAML